MLARDQAKQIAAQNTRIEVLEFFIREKFPGDFAGEVGLPDTPHADLVDPDIKPMVLHLGPLVSSLIKEDT